MIKAIVECSCDGPGYCPRIGCVLNYYGYNLCKHHPEYRRLWFVHGGAPCISQRKFIIRRWGLGTLIAAFIKIVTCGRVKPCGPCNGREVWLNNLVGFTTRKKNPNYIEHDTKL